MQCIIQQLRGNFPHTPNVNVFSDGPISRFKQRFLFSDLHYWETDHELMIRWSHIMERCCRGKENSWEACLIREISHHHFTKVCRPSQQPVPKHSCSIYSRRLDWPTCPVFRHKMEWSHGSSKHPQNSLCPTCMATLTATSTSKHDTPVEDNTQHKAQDLKIGQSFLVNYEGRS